MSGNIAAEAYAQTQTFAGAASCNFARGNESFSCTGDDYVIRKVEDSHVGLACKK